MQSIRADQYGAMRLIRAVLMTLLCFGLAASAGAADRQELDSRIRHLTARLDAMQQKPDKRIPESILNDAEGVLLLERTHAGFIFGFEGGSGVALARDPQTRQWSAPAFYGANEASLGPQIGIQQSFVVMLFLSRHALPTLAESRFQIAAEAQGTADSRTGTTSKNFTTDRLAIIVCDDREGFYGGAVLKFGSFSPDLKANAAYHQRLLAPREILFKNETAKTEAAIDLARVLDGHRARIVPTDTSLTATPSPSQVKRRQPVFKGVRIMRPEPAHKHRVPMQRTRPQHEVERPESAPRLVPEPAAQPIPVEGTPADKLKELVAELRANGQTNELQLLSDYLTTMATTLHATEASTSVAALEHLRSGRTNDAIDLLEGHLDSSLSGLESTLESTPEAERPPSVVETLDWVRRYRETHPR